MLVLLGFLLWASSGRLSDDALATTTRYDARFAPLSDTLTVATYNIGYLSGMTNNRPVNRPRALFAQNMDAAAALLRRADADVVGFQEIDFGAARSYRVHQLDTLARRLGYPASATAVNWDERYVPFPYHWNPARHFGRLLSGQAVLSRRPIVGHRRIELARTSRPFWNDMFYLDRLAQVVHLDGGADTLAVINVHLEAFEQATREAQAAAVNALYRREAARHPTLLMGDVNSVLPRHKASLPPPDSARYAGDSTLATLLEGTGLQPAVPDAFAATFPADAPRRMIDHIFYDPARFTLLDVQIVGGGSSPPSDHRAVVARFAISPRAILPR